MNDGVDANLLFPSMMQYFLQFTTAFCSFLSTVGVQNRKSCTEFVNMFRISHCRLCGDRVQTHDIPGTQIDTSPEWELNSLSIYGCHDSLIAINMAAVEIPNIRNKHGTQATGDSLALELIQAVCIFPYL